MGQLQDKVLNKFFNQLIMEGFRILNYAARTNDTLGDAYTTFNMMDAYATAVYYQGKRVRTRYSSPFPDSTGVHKGWPKHHIQAGTGRGYLATFFRNFQPTTNGICLICVNVIYYSSILEAGKQGGLGRKYHIISQISGEFSKLQSKFKGSEVVGIGINRGRQVN